MESNHSCRSFRYSRERNGEEKKKSENVLPQPRFHPLPSAHGEDMLLLKAPVTFIILRDISSSDDVLEMEVPQEVNLVTFLL